MPDAGSPPTWRPAARGSVSRAARSLRAFRLRSSCGPVRRREPAAAVDDAAHDLPRRLRGLSRRRRCRHRRAGRRSSSTGRAGLDFYLSTGRMPLERRRRSRRTARAELRPRDDHARSSTYIAAPPGFSAAPTSRSSTPRTRISAQGGDLYRLNCAACHAWSGRGGALLHREAPPLDESTPTQIVEAMLVGPGNMPSFGPGRDRQRAGHADVAAYTEPDRGDPDDAAASRCGISGRCPKARWRSSPACCCCSASRAASARAQ